MILKREARPKATTVLKRNLVKARQKLLFWLDSTANGVFLFAKSDSFNQVENDHELETTFLAWQGLVLPWHQTTIPLLVNLQFKVSINLKE